MIALHLWCGPWRALTVNGEVVAFVRIDAFAELEHLLGRGRRG